LHFLPLGTQKDIKFNLFYHSDIRLKMVSICRFEVYPNSYDALYVLFNDIETLFGAVIVRVLPTSLQSTSLRACSSSVSLLPPPHFELGVQNRLDQFCSNCAGPFPPILRKGGGKGLGRRQPPIANFGFETTGINCASIVLNCAAMFFNCTGYFFPLSGGWFSALSPLHCEFRIRNNGNQLRRPLFS